MQPSESTPNDSGSNVTSVGGAESTEARELAAATNEMFRRIGRNLVNYQKIEAMLKFLLAHGSLSGPMREFASLRDRRVAAISKTMMGMLVGRFSGGKFGEAVNADEAPADTVEPWLQFQVSFERTDDFHELCLGLESLVVERNELVHSFLSKWDARSLETTRRLSGELEAQRERLIPVYEKLQCLVSALQHGAKAHAELLASPEGQEMLGLSPSGLGK
jgi:hypothetical protein